MRWDSNLKGLYIIGPLLPIKKESAGLRLSRFWSHKSQSPSTPIEISSDWAWAKPLSVGIWVELMWYPSRLTSVLSRAIASLALVHHRLHHQAESSQCCIRTNPATMLPASKKILH